MSINKIDVSTMKSLVEKMDNIIYGIERRVLSCELEGLISDFGIAKEFIRKAEPIVLSMRIEEPENNDILEISENLISINKRYSDTVFNLENKCSCNTKLQSRNDIQPVQQRNDIQPVQQRNDIQPVQQRNDIQPVQQRNDIKKRSDATIQYNKSSRRLGTTFWKDF